MLCHYLPRISKLVIYLPAGVSEPELVKGHVCTLRELLKGGGSICTYRGVQLPLDEKTNIPSEDGTISPSFPQLISQVLCKQCRQSLLCSPSSALRALQLPGRYWMELIDCWSCHRNEFATLTGKLRLAADGMEMLPSPGQALCSNYAVMIGPQDYDREAIVVVQEDGAPQVRCACGLFLGLAKSCTEAHTTPYVQLLLAQVIILDAIHDRELVSPSALSTMLSELLEAIDAHGTADFVIEGVKDGKAQTVLLHMISWQSLIQRDSHPHWTRAIICSFVKHSSSPNAVHFAWNAEYFALFAEALQRGIPLAKQLGLESMGKDPITVLLHE